MYILQTIKSIKECLVKQGNIVDYAKKEGVSAEDVPFLEYMQANDLAKIFAALAAEYTKYVRQNLNYCMTHENPNFTVKDVSNRVVDIAKLKELRPDVYQECRKLPDKFYNKRFTPVKMMEIMLEYGVTIDEIKANETVTITDTKTKLSEDEQSIIFVKDTKSPKIDIYEVTDKSPGVIVTEVTE